jgi:hypothetical protein
MSSTAYAREQREDQREHRQSLRLVEAEALQSKSRGDTLEVVGLAVIVLAAWFMLAMIFVPGLSGILG